jgi:hypothetical protein
MPRDTRRVTVRQHFSYQKQAQKQNYRKIKTTEGSICSEKCGSEIDDGAKFCSNCGAPAGNADGNARRIGSRHLNGGKAPRAVSRRRGRYTVGKAEEEKKNPAAIPVEVKRSATASLFTATGNTDGNTK